MKLYATITSERATKGQGGNKRLDIEVLYGGKEIQKKACSVYLSVNPTGTLMTIIDNINTTLFHGYIEIEKGEKKKGECSHDYDNYGKCCNCGKWRTE